MEVVTPEKPSNNAHQDSGAEDDHSDIDGNSTIEEKDTNVNYNENDDVKDPNHIAKGMKLIKKFNDGKYYEGKVISGPEWTVDTHETVWKIKYDDGEQEDLTFEEIVQGRNELRVQQSALRRNPKRQCTRAATTTNASDAPVESAADNNDAATTATTSTTPTTSTKISKRQATMDLAAARKDLNFRMGMDENEVEAVLSKMQPPYLLNKAVAMVHQARLEKELGDQPQEEETKFVPHIGLRVRKLFDGCQYYGSVINDGELCNTDDGRKDVKHWKGVCSCAVEIILSSSYVAH